MPPSVHDIVPYNSIALPLATAAETTAATLAWQVSDSDRLWYDTISADLYCMDREGPEGGLWRHISTLFSDISLQSPTTQYNFVLPDCGALALDGAIRIGAEGRTLGVGVEQETSCYFTIEHVPAPRLMPPVPRQPLLPTEVSPTTTPTQNHPSTSPVARIPRISPTYSSPNPSPTPESTKKPLVPFLPLPVSTTSSTRVLDPFIVTDSPSPASSTTNPLPKVGSTATSDGTRVTAVTTSVPEVSGSATPSGQPYSTQSPQATVPVSGGTGPGTGGSSGGSSGSTSGGGIGISSNRPSSGGSGMPSGPNDDTSNHRSTIMTVGAILGGFGLAACLALVVMSLVIRRRRRRAAALSASQSTIPRLLEPGGLGDGTGVVMKETKRRFRLERKPKEGYFYRMEDQEDDMISSRSEILSSAEKVGTNNSIEGGEGVLYHSSSAGATATVSTSFARTGNDGMDYPPVILPPNAHLDAAVLMSHLRKTPSLFGGGVGGSLSRSQSMSSIRSSVDNSSVIRRYWEAAMAARAERMTQDPFFSRHDLEVERGLTGGERGERPYEEGSIFGCGRSNTDASSGRDSESRMADILSLRTADSGDGSAAASSKYRYMTRRSTLNSMGAASSFWQRRSSASETTLSSIPDSLMITEEEYLERLQMHQMQMQMEEQGYYDHQYGRYPSTISRSDSMPSLTSSNDPFKTFDSNDVLVNMDFQDPFSDERAQSRSSQRSDWRL
ncbi:hypothetical protein EDD11_009360 [Mortierella claussenii]|nr:hypothetical protein EDD11_009360 [Mortierella claussenii]